MDKENKTYGLKEQVKRGEITADQAISILLEKCKSDSEKKRVLTSNTGQWLRKVASGELKLKTKDTKKPDKS